MPTRRCISRRSFRSACAGLLALAACAAHADEPYPTRPIRIIVPFSAGGGIDVLGRTIGQKLSETWQYAAVVENRPGASGNIGTDLAARAAPDGYTYLMTANTIIMTPSFMQGVTFDPVKDFAPVMPIAIGSLALVTRPDFPARSVPQLIELARKQPHKLNYGSPGTGTPHHLAMELVKQRAGIDVVHVPYKGSGGLVNDVLSGQVDLAFVPVHQALQFARAGKMQMLAAGGTRRTAVTPDIPSLAEASGIADVDVDMWYGLYLPAGTPPAIVAKVNAEVARILKMPDVVKSLSMQGLQPSGGTPDDLARLTRDDFQRWAGVIRQAGLSSQ
ncbi:tripartite tricarboxylate transporter substrate binding protein [Pigmentiphaga sp. H8]|uniref:tripartite tricarboxylate transporter substrate binding protein n=1 Tax=Pigmentiphaga sp. H8 TaxID=2488560 RepID=UPI000F5A7840|nr:tripartite tricarboxylate transporter substrate binding protein [Pigmentiphaga sp. H8]AZG10461.1 tripartite tricarboxylate transporter substrate binding protein [Pigmentiphaga sp. H8]